MKTHAEKTNILQFQDIIKYEFNDKNLLKQAFYHSSYTNEKFKTSILSNERLEFLGDAVLEIIISEYIYKKYTKMSEGELTKLRASIVCEDTLAKEARKLKINNYIMLGKGEKITGGSERESLLADSFEAVIGAIFLDGGIENAKIYILSIMENTISKLYKSFRTMDYKTHLQEIIQKNSKETVKYEIIAEAGLDHNKNFIAIAVHNGIKIGQGQGKTKKEAEQSAALNALKMRKNNKS